MFIIRSKWTLFTGFAEEIFQTNDPKTQEIFKDDFVHVSIDLLQISFKRKKVGSICISL